MIIWNIGHVTVRKIKTNSNSDTSCFGGPSNPRLKIPGYRKCQ